MSSVSHVVCGPQIERLESQARELKTNLRNLEGDNREKTDQASVFSGQLLSEYRNSSDSCFLIHNHSFFLSLVIGSFYVSG